MKVKFWKLTGAGNDFVLLDGLPKGRTGAALAKRLCARRFGVGADGLLVVTGRGATLRLDYWNSDGSAAFCGNGSRCAALWAAEHGRAKIPSFTLKSNRGPLSVALTGKGRASVDMPSPRAIKPHRRVAAHFVDTGVPHAVVLVPDVEAVDVVARGRALRFDKAFGKAGANVDYVQFKGNVVLLRTYERGVEDETLACGTGVVAAAFVARACGFDGDPIKVKVRSGAILTVSFKDGARLEGPGETTFMGETEI